MNAEDTYFLLIEISGAELAERMGVDVADVMDEEGQYVSITRDFGTITKSGVV